MRAIVAAIVIALAAASTAVAERIVITANSGSLGGIESVTPFVAAADGTLTAGAPVPVGDRPDGVAITPDARFAYVATGSGVRVFAIGAGGALTPVSGAPVATGGLNPTAVVVTPSGGRLLVGNRGTALNNAADPGSIAVFDIDRATGTIAPVVGSPFAVAGLEGVDALAVTPDSGRVFVAGDAAGATFSPRVGSLNIAPATGALTQVAGSPFASGGTQAFALAITPSGGRVLVGNVNLASSSISVLAHTAATGALAPVAGSPFAPAGRAPIDLAVSADGARLLSAERASAVPPSANGVAAYAIAASGALTPVTGSPFTAGGGQVQGVATTPDGRLAYGFVSSDPGIVAGYSVGATGTLAPLPTSPYPTGDRFAGFLSITMTPSQTPEPAFVATPGAPGRPTTFDASATVVRGGVAARYDWDFGDGATASGDGPTASHVYAAPGTYQVTLTVANDCAAIPGFSGGTLQTGRTAFCNGAPTASRALAVTVAPPAATAAVCRSVPRRSTTSRAGRITLSTDQLRINQAIYAAALRRARAISDWLDDGVATRDLCGGGLTRGVFAPAILVGPPPSVAIARTPPDPRPVVTPRAARKAGVVFRLSPGQLQTNQRIAARAVREANALAARLAAGLTGGDLRPGAVTAATLAGDIGIASRGVPQGRPPATRTVVAPAAGAAAAFRVTRQQLAINQRVGQTAIRRLNALRDRLGAGLTGADFRPGSITSANLAPELG